MANRLIFTLLFGVLQIAPTFLKAFNSQTLQAVSSFCTEQCTAPPPENFRIISLSSDFVTLSWNPFSIGEYYDLTVLENTNTGWSPIYTLFNITGDTLRIDDLNDGTEYRFKIAAKCSNGDPSELTSIIDGITLILELTTGGKTPINPTQINCNEIDFKNPLYKWIGFRISYYENEEKIEKLFELEEVEVPSTNNNYNSKFRIKKVEYDEVIVTADQFWVWPDPIIKSNPFYILDNSDLNNQFEVGSIELILNTNTPTLNLCPVNTTPPWSNKYLYQALVARKIEDPPLHQSENRNALTTSEEKKVSVQNPVKENINIFLSELCSDKSTSKVLLQGIDGKIIINKQFEVALRSITIPVGEIPNGIYLLRVEIDNSIFNFKLNIVY